MLTSRVMIRVMIRVMKTVVLGVLVLPAASVWAAGEKVSLGEGGRAALPIVVSPDASEQVRAAAGSLADCLGKITGGKFEVTPSADHQGAAIRVGTFAHFPDHAPTPIEPDSHGQLPISATTRYLLQSGPDGLNVLGAADQAVENAVWEVLYKMGYRQFFPTSTWEVVPRDPDLSIAIDELDAPDYAGRRIFYGYGYWGYNKQPTLEWQAKNHMIADIEVRSHHVYQAIIKRHADVFEAHPEWIARVEGKPANSQLCVGHKGLRDLVVQDTLTQLRANPHWTSISLEPSDGTHWCDCEKCNAIGTITDQVVFLCNYVAEAIRDEFPNTFIGFAVYSHHSVPPTQVKKIDPQVVPKIATKFIHGGYTVDELIEEWYAAGARYLGIRDYAAVYPWERCMPGQGIAANVRTFAEDLKHYHEKGARFYTTESSDAWGPQGLGYYIMGRMMWDVDSADRVEELIDDFLVKSFGSAKEPMREFYLLINGRKSPLMSEDLIARMYRHLQGAWQASDDPAVRARVKDLALYTWYVECYYHYVRAEGAERQQAFEKVVKLAWRMRETQMVHTKAIYRKLHKYDGAVSVPRESYWDVKQEDNPWKRENDEPYTAAQVEQILAEGVAKYQPLDFTPATYTRDLVPAAAALGLETKAEKPREYTGRSHRRYYTWVENAPATIELTVTGGIINRDRGPVEITFHVASVDPMVDRPASVGVPEGIQLQTLEVPNDRQPVTIQLEAKEKGLHWVEINDHNDMTKVQWDAGTTLTVELSRDSSPRHSMRHDMVFYVPKGTKRVAGYTGNQSSGVNLMNADGEAVYELTGEGRYFDVAVEPGQDGRLWSVDNANNSMLRLMTVPPFLAINADELLLPREVVRQDAGQ